MANLAEIEARLITVESKINGAVEIPKGSVEVNDATVTDKTGWQVYGQIVGIHGGLDFAGISLVANPTLDVHIKEPFYFKDF